MRDVADPGGNRSVVQHEIETLRRDNAMIAAKLAATIDQNIKLRRQLAAMASTRVRRPAALIHKTRSVFLRAYKSLMRYAGLGRSLNLSSWMLSAYRSARLPAGVRLALHRGLLRWTPSLYERLRHAAGIHGPVAISELAGSRTTSADIVGESRFRAGFRRLVEVLAAHSAQHGPLTHVIALPFFSVGGAQLVASNFAAAVEANGTRCLVIATDATLTGTDMFPPDRSIAIDLSEFFGPADAMAREHLLFAVLRMLRPKVFHVINAEVGWRLIINQGARLRTMMRLYGSMFAFQFDPKNGRKIGYAASFLADAMPFLDGLTSDNKRFIDDATREFSFDDVKSRLYVVYNTVEMVDEKVLVGAANFANALPARIRAASRLSVLWAGRLDAEKRPELLLAVASECPEMDFHVYGARVVDKSLSEHFQGRPNLHLHGAYSSAEEVMSRREHHVMMFTSRWEGLANVLIEFGALGLPIVAATVGGVGELISTDTGYPLPEAPTPADYTRALRAVWEDPLSAAARSQRLLELIARQHSRVAFEQAVRSVEGYLT